MTCGIYMIKNKKTGQKYIGQSVDIERRWREHISQGKEKTYIDRAINKHGRDNFILIIIEETTQDNLDDREQYWITYYNTYYNINHYNLSPGGDINPMNDYSSRKKLSKVLSGRIRTKEHRLSLAYSRNSTGFLHVTKEYNDAFKQGFRWIYRCKEDNKTITITSTSSEKLRNKVLERNLEWETIDDDNAKKSILEEKKFLGNKRNTSGYYHVHKQKDKQCKQGFRWVYSYKDEDKIKTIKRVNFDELKKEVQKRGLLWREL